MLVRALALLALLWATLAAAHPMPESRVWIDTQPDGLRLTLQLPLNRLEFAFGHPLADAPATVLAQHGDALARYLMLHVGARSGNVGWQALRPQLRVVGTDGSAELEASMRLVAPAGVDPRTPTLLLDVITHEVRTHRIQVFVRNDWAAGVVDAKARPLGELNTARTSLTLALGTPQAGAALLALLRDGAQHIAEGTDHLLFLLMLLLAAPLVAQRAQWGAARQPVEALRQVTRVVSAFTLGHSLTLALGSTGLVQLPSQAVEVAVAATIAVAAVHVWRPLFAAAETWMALGFGLVHGFAFSASLRGAGLTAGQHAWALLGFNLGIEAMQLALVAAVLPPLLVLASRRRGWFGIMQRVAAALALLASGLWMAERLGAVPPDIAFQVPVSAMQLALLVLLVLLVVWLLATAAWRKPTRRASRGADLTPEKRTCPALVQRSP